MTAESTTVDLSHARGEIASLHARRTHAPRHRHPNHTDWHAGVGLLVLAATGVVGVYAVLLVIGAW